MGRFGLVIDGEPLFESDNRGDLEAMLVHINNANVQSVEIWEQTEPKKFKLIERVKP